MKHKGIFRKIFTRRPAREEQTAPPLNTEEKEMIRGVVELSDSIVREIMVPRTDAVFIESDIALNELIATAVESGYSRFPVYTDRIDNDIGLLYAKDLLQSLGRTDVAFDITKIIRKPYFVPETKKLDSLLKEFKRRKVHIAVVVDEYGGTSGIVCLEDVIEEIVGEIQDEFDHEPEDVLKIGENVWLCDARVNLADLNQELPFKLPEDDFDSLGGFVFDLFGRIPELDEKVEYNNRLDFVVQKMEGRKIMAVKIMLKRDDNVKEAPVDGGGPENQRRGRETGP